MINAKVKRTWWKDELDKQFNILLKTMHSDGEWRKEQQKFDNLIALDNGRIVADHRNGILYKMEERS